MEDQGDVKLTKGEEGGIEFELNVSLPKYFNSCRGSLKMAAGFFLSYCFRFLRCNQSSVHSTQRWVVIDGVSQKSVFIMINWPISPVRLSFNGNLIPIYKIFM